MQLSLFITFIRNETETEGISKIITLQVVAQFLHLDEHFRSTMCLVFSHCVFAPSRQPVSCWLLKVFHHNDFFRVTFTSVCCITTEKHTVTPLQRKRTVRWGYFGDNKSKPVVHKRPVARVKCWLFMFLQTRDTFTFVHVTRIIQSSQCMYMSCKCKTTVGW